MKGRIHKLMMLRGVGDVLARRLVKSGIDCYDKIVLTGEAGLLKIKGMNPKVVPAIISQAEEMGADLRACTFRKEEELKQATNELKERVQGIALDVRERFSDDLSGAKGKKVEKEISKVIVSLEKVESKLRTRGKRAAKGLARAGTRIDGLQEAGPGKLRKGLKEARKSLKRVLA